MIARSRRFALRTVADYRHAIDAFSPNARRLLTGQAVQNLAVGMLATVFAIYVRGAGMSESVIGGVEGSIATASAVVCLVAPPLIAVFGYRRLLVVAALAYAASRAGQAALPATLPLLAFAVVGGVGEGIMQSAVAPFLSENSTSAERTHLFSVDLAVKVTAAFIGGLAGGVLPVALGLFTGEIMSYRLTVGLAAVLLAASTLPLLGISEHRHGARHAFGRYMSTLRTFGSWRHVGALVVPQVLIAFGAGMVMPFLALYLKRHLGASIAEVGLIMGVSALAMGVAALLGPAITRRLGLVRGMVGVQALSLPLMLVIPFVSSLPVLAVILWVRSGLMNLSWPLYNQYAMSGVPGREKPLVAGWLAFAWSIGWLGGSVLGGSIMTWSYTLPYVFATVLYGAGVAATALLFREPAAEVPVPAPAEAPAITG